MTSVTNRAVVERRSEAVDSLDFFPTPPWATRALFEHIGDLWAVASCWEPAAGMGHMAEVLRDYFGVVHASDVHDYGVGYEVGSFVGSGGLALDVATAPEPVDWIITNPPFNAAEDFLDRALGVARTGVALLLRTNWVDTQGRYDRVFSTRPPSRILQFADRVPMIKGRWDPEASTATAYAWFVWEPQHLWPTKTTMEWIASGAPKRCSCSDDIARFAHLSINRQEDL